jgi:ribosomal protein L40E
MDTPAQRFQKQLNELFQKFLKTPLVIPVAIALATLVYAGVLMYLGSFCLNGLIAPLFLLGILWKFNIKKIKPLLIAGAVATMFFTAAWVGLSTDFYMNVEPAVARSDNSILVNGTVTPFSGDDTTVYTYSLEIRLPNNHTTVSNVSASVLSLEFPSGALMNYTMSLGSHDDSTNTSYYSYSTTISKPVSQFIFWAKVNGTWEVATDHRTDAEYPLWGPVQDDPWAIAAILIPLGLLNVYGTSFIVYALLVFMVWWTRRARNMRVKAYEKAVTEKEQETSGVKKVDAKVPSLAKAMGKESEGAFVCSECGADVPAEATVCPKCGEKFD